MTDKWEALSWDDKMNWAKAIRGLYAPDSDIVRILNWLLAEVDGLQEVAQEILESWERGVRKLEEILEERPHEIG